MSTTKWKEPLIYRIDRWSYWIIPAILLIVGNALVAVWLRSYPEIAWDFEFGRPVTAHGAIFIIAIAAHLIVKAFREDSVIHGPELVIGLACEVFGIVLVHLCFPFPM